MSTRYAVIDDKIIVDRRKPRRNSEVSQFLRKNREMLVQKSDNPDFDREMLQLHARTMVSSLPAISLLVFMVAVGGLFIGKSADILPSSHGASTGLRSAKSRYSRASGSSSSCTVWSASPGPIWHGRPARSASPSTTASSRQPRCCSPSA